MAAGKQDIRLTEALCKEAILTDLKSADKTGVIEELAATVSGAFSVSKDELVRVLNERERVGSTGIGGGIGIPHGKLQNIEIPILGVGLSRKGVNFESMDGRPTHIFFLLITPESASGYHLQLLARISRMLKNESFKKRLLHSADSNEVFNLIKEADDAL